MLPQSHSGGFPTCFQRPVQRVNSRLALWKTQGQNTEQWQLVLVLLHLNNSVLVCKSCRCLSQGNSYHPKQPFHALHRNDSLKMNHRKMGKNKMRLDYHQLFTDPVWVSAQTTSICVSCQSRLQSKISTKQNTSCAAFVHSYVPYSEIFMEQIFCVVEG